MTDAPEENPPPLVPPHAGSLSSLPCWPWKVSCCCRSGFSWFPFNQHKGWTVLIAVASGGRGPAADVPLVSRRPGLSLRFQFSILSLLVLMVVVAVPFSWLATEMKQARKQREAVEGIEKAGGRVSYDYQLDPSGNADTRCHSHPGQRGCGSCWETTCS